MKFSIKAFDDAKHRKDFYCGNEHFDRYFKKQMSQDVKRRVTTCFVAMCEESDDLICDGENVAGFYTLASTSVPITDLPEALSRKLPPLSEHSCGAHGASRREQTL